MKLIRVTCKDVDIASRREEFLKTFSNLKINGKAPRSKILWNGPCFIWPIDKTLEIHFDDNDGEIQVVYEREDSQGNYDASAQFSSGWDMKKIVTFLKSKGEKK